MSARRDSPDSEPSRQASAARSSSAISFGVKVTSAGRSYSPFGIRYRVYCTAPWSAGSSIDSSGTPRSRMSSLSRSNWRSSEALPPPVR